MTDTNQVQISGKLAGQLQYSHTAYTVDFYCGQLCSKRLSGQEDILPVLVPGKLKEHLPAGTNILLKGQIRSYNEYSPEGTHLRLQLYVKGYGKAPAEDCNSVQLEGHLCKSPIYRVTPFGREIADLLLAVNRAHGKSDYIPVIVWGKNARFAKTLETGQKLRIEGRFQSRIYEKLLPDGREEQRTAYEVSAGSIYLIL